jgi:trehalose synthase
MQKKHRIVQIEDYAKYIGAEAVERMQRKAKLLKDLHIVNVSSTYYGGGVAELLSAMSLLMNSLGIETGWRVIQGSPDFFSVTKKMHNALQGGEINLSEQKIKIYEEVVYENAVRNHLEQDIVIVHDPQPLPMINHYRRRGPWIWRCHIDLTNPHKDTWNYLKSFIDKYDGMILSVDKYRQSVRPPQMIFMPAIDPFSIKNREFSANEIKRRLDHYNIPTDLPLVVQISRFDRWKDPEGVIEAFKMARKKVDATLVLLGDLAADDPEGEEVYRSLLDQREERIIILSRQDTALVNALQRSSAVVLQKSIREGFGLTVAEAMWKGKVVIGGNVGGIPCQIKDGFSGFLVSSVEEAAERIVQVLKDSRLREQIGNNARETVKKNFLLSNLAEKYLDMFNSIQTTYKIS